MTNKKQNLIVFITGTSGAGKSMLVPHLKEHLPSFEVHDFDELGVPENVDINWRLETTDYWLKIAKENLSKNKSTVISGTSIPDEIFISSEYNISLEIWFGIIKTADSTIHERLTKRNWEQSIINDYIRWQNELIEAVKETKNHRVISGDQSLADITEDIRNWLIC